MRWPEPITGENSTITLRIAWMLDLRLPDSLPSPYSLARGPRPNPKPRARLWGVQL